MLPVNQFVWILSNSHLDQNFAGQNIKRNNFPGAGDLILDSLRKSRLMIK